MPKLVHRQPAYRLHKARGLACVTLNGRTHYLGPYGSAESRTEYARLVAEWQNRATRPAPPTARERRQAKAAIEAAAEPIPLTIVELVDRFLAHAQIYYVGRDGKPGNECQMFRSALRPLLELYLELPAKAFRPRHLKAIRQHLVANGWTRTGADGKILRGTYSRKVINSYSRRIKHVFAWGVEEELLPAGVHARLMRVRGLRRGRTAAKEKPPVRPVSDETLERTLPWLPPTVRALVQFQRWTGCRPGEACDVRPADVDTTSEPWTYRPRAHKTEHHGHERRIFIGPKAREVLRPLLLRPAEAHCFSPADSERWRKRELRERRLSKVQPSQVDRSKAAPERTPSDRYGKDSYARAIARAVARANRAEVTAAEKEGRTPELLERWSPNQLRHARATELRQRFGVEAAQVALGHADPKTTLIYAEADHKLAADVASKTG